MGKSTGLIKSATVTETMAEFQRSLESYLAGEPKVKGKIVLQVELFYDGKQITAVSNVMERYVKTRKIENIT